MFIFFHLIVALAIGYLLADRFQSRAFVLPCILGGLLPDLVDKPIGLILLADSIGSGRVFLHTALFLLVMLVAGGILFMRWRSPVILAVGVGVASHQFLDLMWQTPATWLYPLLGSFPATDREGWFLREFLLELQNPGEWVSGMLLFLLILTALSPRLHRLVFIRFKPLFRPLTFGAGLILGLLGLLILSAGAMARLNHVAGGKAYEYSIVVGVTFTFLAYAAFHAYTRLSAGDERSSSNR